MSIVILVQSSRVYAYTCHIHFFTRSSRLSHTKSNKSYVWDERDRLFVFFFHNIRTRIRNANLKVLTLCEVREVMLPISFSVSNFAIYIADFAMYISNFAMYISNFAIEIYCKTRKILKGLTFLFFLFKNITSVH